MVEPGLKFIKLHIGYASKASHPTGATMAAANPALFSPALITSHQKSPVDDSNILKRWAVVVPLFHDAFDLKAHESTDVGLAVVVPPVKGVLAISRLALALTDPSNVISK
jgi:hypothetical protein